MPDGIPKKASERESQLSRLLSESRKAQDAFNKGARQYEFDKSSACRIGYVEAMFAKMTEFVVASLEIQKQQEEEIKNLRAQITELENPKPVVLDKKRLPPQNKP